MTEYCNTIYLIYCGTVHCPARDLGEYFLKAEETYSENLEWGPENTGLKNILSPAIEILFKSLRAITTLFQRQDLDDMFQTKFDIFLKLNKK